MRESPGHTLLPKTQGHCTLGLLGYTVIVEPSILANHVYLAKSYNPKLKCTAQLMQCSIFGLRSLVTAW